MDMGREKKMRVLCKFCECSGSRFVEPRPNGQDQEASSSMEREISRLRLLTRRMTGKDLDGLSYAELRLLESQLRDALLIVKNQKEKVKLLEDERLCKQEKKGAKVKDGFGRELSVPYTSSGSSSEDRPQKPDDVIPEMRTQKAFERRMFESPQMEFERLWIFKERMNGRNLDGMTLHEVVLLEIQIYDGLKRVRFQSMRPRMEELARQLKEETMSLLAKQETCLLANGSGKDDRHRDISLRLFSVSRKLRRFQNRCHRKDMPEKKMSVLRIDMGREKKMSVLCNFCECSGSRFVELRPRGQDQEASSSMGRELSRLRFLTRRMTGKDLDGLNYAELSLLQSQLTDALLIVKNHKEKVKLLQEKKSAEFKDGFGRSSGSRKQEAFERRMCESPQMEFERLWILNERMNGRNLDGMTLEELFILELQIYDGIEIVLDQKMRPRMEELARQLKEEKCLR
ncbi:PREDICTED: uncharacterized protein LOC104785208 isoform X2 [Camelina sativa]|uniref:Uncharacterized protein LOC104785208 isoform X2 n=1 Tax=Camelina sativa TaxID=90675 RepID=A0ABM0Z0F0_CAMSA|nr:PREDICTED: uncharacterized protein LOC104785208 isoform X2 [Camelina sativa]